MPITSKQVDEIVLNIGVKYVKLHAGFYIQIFVFRLAANSSLIACADIDAEQCD
jgi:hypothetical protein